MPGTPNTQPRPPAQGSGQKVAAKYCRPFTLLATLCADMPGMRGCEAYKALCGKAGSVVAQCAEQRAIPGWVGVGGVCGGGVLCGRDVGAGAGQGGQEWRGAGVKGRGARSQRHWYVQRAHVFMIRVSNAPVPPFLHRLPTWSVARNDVFSACDDHPMSACATCSSTDCPNPLGSLAGICHEMPNMAVRARSEGCRGRFGAYRRGFVLL